MVEADSNLLNVIEVNQRNDGILMVGITLHVGLNLAHRLKVRLPYIQGGLLETDSAASIGMYRDGFLRGESFDIRSNSTGDIEVNVNAKKVIAVCFFDRLNFDQWCLTEQKSLRTALASFTDSTFRLKTSLLGKGSRKRVYVCNRVVGNVPFGPRQYRIRESE